MTEQSAAATTFDHNSTLVLALELSGKGWQVGAVLPGVARRPRRSVAPRDVAGLLAQIERWKAEAQRAGRTVLRTVLAYEAGRDGFWIARCLLAHGIEVQIMHPASIPVERRGRRAKTDRIDLDMLLRTLLAWLRGEPRVCSMVRIPSETEEDMRRPERERERLVSERIALENRIENLLCLHGVAGFKPRLKKAAERLDSLRSFAGAPLPPMLLEELHRLMTNLGGHDLDCLLEALEGKVLSEHLAQAHVGYDVVAAAQQAASARPWAEREDVLPPQAAPDLAQEQCSVVVGLARDPGRVHRADLAACASAGYGRDPCPGPTHRRVCAARHGSRAGRAVFQLSPRAQPQHMVQPLAVAPPVPLACRHLRPERRPGGDRP